MKLPQKILAKIFPPKKTPEIENFSSTYPAPSFQAHNLTT